MATQLQYTPEYAFADGAFSAGAKVSFFLSGTTTPATVYADQALTTPHPSPLVADATGRFATVWGANGVNYKAVITAADDSAIATVDPVVLGNVSISNAATVSFSPAGALASTDVQAAIEELDTEKAPLASPALTGTPTSPTASAGADTTQIATTAFVQQEIDRTGSYTATLTPATSGTVTLSSNTLYWYRIGNLCFVSGGLVVSAISSPTGGNMTLNLPFTVQRTTGCIVVQTNPIASYEAEVLASGTSLTIWQDASTVAVSRQYRINLTFVIQ